MVLVEMWVALVSMTRDSPKSASCATTSAQLSSHGLLYTIKVAAHVVLLSSETLMSLLVRSSKARELPCAKWHYLDD